MLVPALFKAYALKNMFASKAAFIASLDPFVTALYSYFFWSERFNQEKNYRYYSWLYRNFNTFNFHQPELNKQLMAWSIFSYPEIAAFLAMAIGRLGWMFVQQLLRKERYTAAED